MMINSGKRWSKDDNKYILDSIKNDINISNIALELGRTERSVECQLDKLLKLYDENYENKYKNFLKEQAIVSYDILLKSINISNVSTKLLKPDLNVINKEIKSILDNIISNIEDTNELNKEQLYAYNSVKNGNNIFISGSSGAGKSYCLKQIIKYLIKNKKKIGITSSTGSSASLIDGVTLHSFLKIGLATKSAEELYENVKIKYPSILNKIKNLDVLIIDEISMIDNILFSKIAKYISLIKGINKPFGNLQLILCGDFHQLPPINNLYCFESKVWNN
jgi:DNA replication protein DnaC